jgi:AraC-like DNA-binding protein
MLDSYARPFDAGLAAAVLPGFHAAAPDANHPLAHIRRVVDQACIGHAVSCNQEAQRRGMTAARLLRAALLQSLYSYSCGEQLMEQLRYNALYRWFVGLHADEPTWDAAAYTRALDGLRASEAGAALFSATIAEAHAYATLLPGRFRVDPSLLEAWRGARPGSAGKTGDARPSRLDQARAVILRRIGDPALTPDQIASELCVSRRALYLLFEKHGLTPTRAIRELRLDCCLKLLADERHRHRKITDIAMDYGFEHATSFSRQFKLRYGISPNAARGSRRPVGGGSRNRDRHVGAELASAH